MAESSPHQVRAECPLTAALPPTQPLTPSIPIGSIASVQRGGLNDRDASAVNLRESALAVPYVAIADAHKIRAMIDSVSEMSPYALDRAIASILVALHHVLPRRITQRRPRGNRHRRDRFR